MFKSTPKSVGFQKKLTCKLLFGGWGFFFGGVGLGFFWLCEVGSLHLEPVSRAVRKAPES